MTSKMTITAKVKLLPSKEDIDLIEKTTSRYCDVCNYISKHIYDTRNLAFRSLQDELYYKIRDDFGFKSQMTISAIKTVIGKYKTIQKNVEKKKERELKHRKELKTYPRKKRKPKKIEDWIMPIFKVPQIDLVRNRDYSIKDDIFSINTLEKRIKVPFVKKGMELYFDTSKYRFGTAKVVTKQGQCYLYIPVTFETETLDLNDTRVVVGIDRGINFLATTYDNSGHTGFVSGKSIKQKRAAFARTRKELQRKETPSSRRRLKRIGHRENRWMQDVNHCVTKALVNKYPKNTLFVLEDLTNIREATERVRVKSRYVSVSWAYYDFEQKLIYKARLNQSEVIKVNPRYTSQRCPVCGYTEKSNRDKKKHLFCCKECGYKSNDDRIGAMNIYMRGIEALNRINDYKGA